MPPFLLAARRRMPLFIMGMLLGMGLLGCDPPDTPEAPTTFAATFTTWNELPGWSEANAAPAAEAMLRSCSTWSSRAPDESMHPDRAWYGTVGAWQHACMRLAERPDSVSIERRFWQLFQPIQLHVRNAEPLLTGYYEPILNGSRTPTASYTEPLRAPPPDLVRIDLSAFRDRFEGETLLGRVDGNQVRPYYDRAAIEAGALREHDLGFLWVDSRVDKFFLQIQGSGRIELRDGSLTRVGYAGQNGQPYRAIGRDLIEMGEVPREEMSMQRIRDWLAAHPEQADDLMNRNASYIFFQERTDLDPEDGPIGSQGVPLIPEHSLAVDPTFVPLGTPVWIDGTAPTAAPNDTTAVPFQRLMVAQDTGGAIRGPLRGDVFWGNGPDAETRAGRMQHPARWYVLVPRTVFLGS
ncbi:MAG: MltA domain-containing protein [Longimonas sp.]|uniref:murein transglycosylase A n=1 Tax=Longimonas sp. TaxID=2039626 RepID=UPI00335A0FB5